MADANPNQVEITPDERLRTLDKLVGTWKLHHQDLNSGEEWEGKDRYAWLDGGFFMEAHHEEFGKNVKGVMLIGYEKTWENDTPGQDLMARWFESSTGYHYNYIWEVTSTTITYWFENRDTGMAFNGKFSDDFNTISGTWKWPGGGYNLTMTKITD